MLIRYTRLIGPANLAVSHCYSPRYGHEPLCYASRAYLEPCSVFEALPGHSRYADRVRRELLDLGNFK